MKETTDSDCIDMKRNKTDLKNTALLMLINRHSEIPGRKVLYIPRAVMVTRLAAFLSHIILYNYMY